MIGLIWLDRVRLRRRKAMREFATRPLLAGRIDPMRGGTRLRLRFRAPLPAYSALAHAFPLLLLMVWFAMLAPNSLGVSTDDFAPLLMAAFVFVILPVVIFFIGSRHAEAELLERLRLVARHAEARPMQEQIPPVFPRR